VDVEKWWQTVGAVLWGHGARCLLVVDHVNKDAATRGKYPSGSKRKLEGADVGLQVEVIKHMSRRPPQDGLAKITVMKDRPGHLPRPRAGELHLDIDGDGIIGTVAPPAEQDAGKPFRPTNLMEKASRGIEKAPGITKNKVEKSVRGNASAVRLAIACLVEEGHVRADDGPKGAILLTSIKPYRQAEDPTSSNLVPTSSGTSFVGPRPTSSLPPRGGRGGRGRGGGDDEEEPSRDEDEDEDVNVPWDDKP
jgi:hypothetical protein